jgi:hypothetical protein
MNDMIEDVVEKKPELTEAEKKANNKEMIKKLKKQNPGVKIKPTAGGGFQIVNPRAPSPLLNSLIKRLEKK